MGPSLEVLEGIVLNRVCAVCTERTADGQCGLEKGSSCALFTYFHRVVQAVESVDSPGMPAYVDAVRREVCAICPEQDRTGFCETRQQARCALEAYLPLVVEAIEAADRKKLAACGCAARTGISR